MNPQYSPRTDAVIGTAPFTETMRWVALAQRGQSVRPPVDHAAMGRTWDFRSLAATKSLDTAANVHECIGRLLANLVVQGLAVTGRGQGQETAMSLSALGCRLGRRRRAGDDCAVRARGARRTRSNAARRSRPEASSARRSHFREAHRAGQAAQDRRHRFLVDLRRGRELAGRDLSEPARGRTEEAASRARRSRCSTAASAARKPRRWSRASKPT